MIPAGAATVEAILGDIAHNAGHIGDLKSDRVVMAFERQILSGRLPAGSKLPTEGELCAILGVSRSVVRDSVRTLVARGLLVVRQGRGTTVAEPTDEAFSNALAVLLTRSGLTMGEVFQARAIIDTCLVGLAATNGTDDDWARLEETYGRFAEAVNSNDDPTATRWHAKFHGQILEAVHQPALTLMLRPMGELTIVSGAASVRRASPEDWELPAHEPILKALRAGDPEAATRAMAAHYELSTRPAAYQGIMDMLFSDAYFSGS